MHGLESMGQYFKPFTSYSLIVALSIVAIVCQTIPVLVHVGRRKWTNNDIDKSKVDGGNSMKLEFIKENIDETIFMFAFFKCRKSDKGRNWK